MDVWTIKNSAPCLRDTGIKSASLGTIKLMGSTKTWLPRCSGLWVSSVPSRRLLVRTNRSSNQGGRLSFFAPPRYGHPLYIGGSRSHVCCLQGWGAPAKYKGEFIEGSFHSHQVPLPDAGTDPEGLKTLNTWLSSYQPGELFAENGKPIDEILSIIPEDEERRLGQVKEAYAGRELFDIPNWKKLAVESGSEQSCMKTVGKYMDLAFQANPTGLRLFSPDELESNKLNAVFEHTSRNFQWDEFSSGQGGRVIEILSEHICQGFFSLFIHVLFQAANNDV